MSQLWQSLMRVFTGRPDELPVPRDPIPVNADDAIAYLRSQRREADQQTRLLRNINRRMDPAAALRLARQRREEAR